MRQVIFTLLLVSTGSLTTHAAPAFPPGHPPKLWLASAVEEEGKVVVQIYESWPANLDDHPAADDIIWRELRPVTLGETVHAYGVDGETLAADTVLEALENPAGVAVFELIYPFDPPEPPEFYRSLLREGTIILVVDGADIRELVP